MAKISDPIWYIYKNNKKSGPFTIQQVIDFHRVGSIDNLTLLWRRGQDKWVPYRKAKKSFYDLPPPPPPVPVKPEKKRELPDLPSLPSLPPLPVKELKTTEPLKVGLPSVPSIPVEKLDDINESDLLTEEEVIAEQRVVPIADESLGEVIRDEIQELSEVETVEIDDETPTLEISDEVIHENVSYDVDVEEPLEEPQEEYQEELEVGNEPLIEIDESVDVHASEQVEEHYDEGPLGAESEKKKYPVISTVMGGISLVTISTMVLVTLSFYSGQDSEVNFRNISIDVLGSLTKKRADDKFYVNFGASKDLNYIFGSSNLVKDAEYEAVFISENEKTDRLVFTSSAIGNKGKVKFERFDFREGEKIEEGEYKIRVSARLTNIFDIVLNYFKNQPVYFETVDEVFIVKKSMEDFENNLKKLKLDKKLKRREQYSVLEEKLSTLTTILTSMGLSYSTALQKDKGIHASKEFEARYASSAGAILQSLIVDDYLDELKSSKNTLAAQNIQAQILTLSKQVAAWSVDLSDSLEKSGNIKAKKRKKLKDKMTKERESFKARVEDLSSLIKEEVERI